MSTCPTCGRPWPYETAQEAARRLGVSVRTLHRRLARGEIQGIRVPGPHGWRWMVPVDRSAGSVRE
jgi:excisionase family DNA binding protein